jgi:hypothetical protein
MTEEGSNDKDDAGDNEADDKRSRWRKKVKVDGNKEDDGNNHNDT